MKCVLKTLVLFDRNPRWAADTRNPWAHLAGPPVGPAAGGPLGPRSETAARAGAGRPQAAHGRTKGKARPCADAPTAATARPSHPRAPRPCPLTRSGRGLRACGRLLRSQPPAGRPGRCVSGARLGSAEGGLPVTRFPRRLRGHGSIAPWGRSGRNGRRARPRDGLLASILPALRPGGARLQVRSRDPGSPRGA